MSHFSIVLSTHDVRVVDVVVDIVDIVNIVDILKFIFMRHFCFVMAT